MPEFTRLIELIEAFAFADSEFKALHRADYNSAECEESYDRRDEALEALYDEFRAVLNSDPNGLSTALRSAATPPR